MSDLPVVDRHTEAVQRKGAARRASKGGGQGWVKPAKAIAFYVSLSVVAILWLLPILLVFSVALKSTKELYSSGGLTSLPHQLDWQNFVSAWRDGNIALYMRNSIIITAIKVPLGIVVEAMAAFALTRMRFKLSTPVFIFILIGMVLPVQAALIPLHTLLQNIGLLDSYVGLIIIYIGFGIPFGILILRGFFLTIPREIDEAAVIEGASNLQLFWRIILPLSWPAVASLIIFDSLFTWNEFIFAQLFITTETKRPMQAGLLAFTSEHAQSLTLLNAGIITSIAPVVMVYLIFQRRFVSGLAGAVKG